MKTDRDLGNWLLPQPPTKEYVSIPKPTFGSTIPFGYVVNGHDNMLLDPVPSELEALEKAKEFLKRYPSRQVAAWLTKQTGRSITHAGLLKRVKYELPHRRKSLYYRRLAQRYAEAIKRATEYEERYNKALKLGKHTEKEFDPSDYYVFVDIANRDDGATD
jgi:hypothetical protein